MINLKILYFILLIFKDKIHLLGDLDDLKLKLREKNSEIDNLHMLVQKVQDDKIKMSKKISKLLENGN